MSGSFPVRYDNQKGKKTAVEQLMKDIKFLLFHKCPQRNHLIFGRELWGEQCLKGWTQWGRRKHRGMNTASRSCEEWFHPEECFADNLRSCFFFLGNHEQTLGRHAQKVFGTDQRWQQREIYFLHQGEDLPRFLFQLHRTQAFLSLSFPSFRTELLPCDWPAAHCQS